MAVRKVRESAEPSKQAGNRGKGRVKGVPNKATAEIKDLARSYTAEAIEVLATVMRTSTSDAAKVAAVNAMLDRGYGKPSQALTGEDGKALFPDEVIWRRASPRT